MIIFGVVWLRVLRFDILCVVVIIGINIFCGLRFSFLGFVFRYFK